MTSQNAQKGHFLPRGEVLDFGAYSDYLEERKRLLGLYCPWDKNHFFVAHLVPDKDIASDNEHIVLSTAIPGLVYTGLIIACSTGFSCICSTLEADYNLPIRLETMEELDERLKSAYG
jgi:hypothetical protein